MVKVIELLTLVITSTLRMSVPIVLTSVGASFSMRVGVTAFGCEGMIITGAFCGVYAAWRTGNNWIGLLFAMVGGILISLVHAYLHVTHRVNATLSGIAVNMLGLSLTELLVSVIWKSNAFSPSIEPFKVFNPPWLESIPFIGPILACQYVFLYIAIVVVIVSWIFMYKTNIGLRLRMVGENPVAAHTVGINTVRYKYLGVMICGLLSGLGGAYLSLAMLSFFQTGMSAGRGFIAMVATNLARSNPLGSAIAGLFFGFFDSLQTMFQGVNFPSQILMAMPYFFTLIAALFTSKGNRRGPAGIGKHFDDE